jgi:hypothetical protein
VNDNIRIVSPVVVAEEDKKSALNIVEYADSSIRNGESSGVVVLMVRPDRSFRIMMGGDLRVTEALGLLEIAGFDLLMERYEKTEK